jgi:hypothetical protein
MMPESSAALKQFYDKATRNRSVKAFESAARTARLARRLELRESEMRELMKHIDEAEILTEAEYSEGGQKFYHVSNEAMHDGTVLTPTGKQWSDADKIIEKYRPAGYLSRQQAVFMFPSFEDADNVGLTGIEGIVEGYLYEVEPIGDRQWHNVWWYDQIVRDLRDYEVRGGAIDEEEFEANIREVARRYWEGEDGPGSGWEVLAPKARIIRYLGEAEDVLYESGALSESPVRDIIGFAIGQLVVAP